jgi:hypothetical protein
MLEDTYYIRTYESLENLIIYHPPYISQLLNAHSVKYEHVSTLFLVQHKPGIVALRRAIPMRYRGALSPAVMFSRKNVLSDFGDMNYYSGASLELLLTYHTYHIVQHQRD